MNTPSRRAALTTVSLEQMLVAREQRAARQAAVLARFGKPLVSMTIVTPGSVKDGPLPRRVMAVALRELEAVSSARNWPILSREVLWRETGPEAIWAIHVAPELFKAATVDLEDHHPLGRLWDLDVIAPGRNILSRKELGFPVRRCLICERPAPECGRSRRHPLEELLNTIKKMVHQYDQQSIA